MNGRALILIAVIVAVLIILAAGGYLIWKNVLPRYAVPAEPLGAEKPAFGVPSDFNISTNPLEKMSNVNPVEKANPFKSLKTNPFEK